MSNLFIGFCISSESNVYMNTGSLFEFNKSDCLMKKCTDRQTDRHTHNYLQYLSSFVAKLFH